VTEFNGYRNIYETEINKALRFSGKSHDFFTKVKADDLAALFAKHFNDNAALKVLDIGCGNGAIHPYLMERVPLLRLSGIDMAGEVIADAQISHPDVAYDVHDGKLLPYADASFDAAFAICVMHHVSPPDWRGFLSEMRRVVRPGGILVVIEHNPINPVTRRIVNNCPLDKNAVLLRSGQVKAMLSETGLQNISTRFILFTPFDNALFRSVDRALGRLPLGAQYITIGSVPA
jgi:ubiquinone/menaquinone biosynthesis C-methylase UbiE